MTIYKAQTSLEKYRALASAQNINQLTGRTDRSDLTDFTMEEIIKKIPIRIDTVLVDIGCGDGASLVKAAENGLDGLKGRLIGILPTSQEVERVRSWLSSSMRSSKYLISIQSGLADQTNLPDGFCDVLLSSKII